MPKKTVDDVSCPVTRDRSGSALRLAALVAWLSWSALFLAVMWIRYAHVMHPGFQWVGITFVTTIVAAVCGLVILIGTVRKRSWRLAAMWTFVLVLPPMVSVAPLVYGMLTMSAMRRPVA